MATKSLYETDTYSEHYKHSNVHVLIHNWRYLYFFVPLQFRTYETLRREHDSQIIKMAMDTGLRISPEQWSTLLYGDHKHKSDMQSIIDKVRSLTLTVARVVW